MPGENPLAEYFLAGRQNIVYVTADHENALPAVPANRQAWYVADGQSYAADAVVFRRPHRHLFNLSQFAATEERFAVVLRQNDAVAIDDITRHLKEAMADGSIPDQDPAMLAHALVGATRHLARTYLYFADEPVELVADVAVRFVLGGLAANGRGRGASP